MKTPPADAMLLLVAPILIQIPYAMLMRDFQYPHILQASPQAILSAYHSAGPMLPWIWFAFAMAILPLMLAISLLPSRFPESRRLRAGTHFGIASAVLQMIGLLRWVFLVPALAQQHNASHAHQREVIEAVFQAQHRLLGMMIGEHLGQLTLGIWTFTLAATMSGRLQKLLGYAASISFAAGSMSNLVRTLDPLPAIAFFIWSVWCCLSGVMLLRSSASPTASARSIS